MTADDKCYLLDTNAFRYYVNKNNRLIQSFWDKVTVNTEEYTLLICDETKREIEIQAINSRLAAEIRRIETELYPLVEEVKYQGDIETEHRLRCLAAHVKYKGYDVKIPKGHGSYDPAGYKSFEYPAVGDARIILAAIANTSGIVTANLAEFAVLRVFGYDVWDPVTDKHVEIDDAVMREVQQDSCIAELAASILG